MRIMRAATTRGQEQFLTSTERLYERQERSLKRLKQRMPSQLPFSSRGSLPLPAAAQFEIRRLPAPDPDFSLVSEKKIMSRTLLRRASNGQTERIVVTGL